MSLRSVVSSDARENLPLRWWVAGLAKALLALVIVYAPLQMFAARYRIVYDAIEGANCLPYSVFLVDLRATNIKRGDYTAFIAEQMEPFYKNGTLAVKLAMAVPSDRVSVGESGVRINGEFKGALLHLQPGERLWRMGKRVADVERDEEVPAGRLWMMGTHARSFDARYWGYIESKQVIGRAIPLF